MILRRCGLKVLFVSTLTVAIQGAVAAHAECTSFCFKFEGQLLFAFNYDFPNTMDDGLIFVNPPGLTKHGWVSNYLGNWVPDKTAENEEWVSKYGSLTFNLAGFQMPSAGTNERGLTVSTMELLETSPPDANGRPHIECTVWVQHVLDTCANVDEVIESLERFVVDGKLHFLVADENGATAIIEFVNGGIVTKRGDARNGSVLTNSTCMSSMAAAEDPSKIDPEDRHKSLARFCTVRKLLNARNGARADPVAYAFNVLAAAKQPVPTQWSIVFDISRKIVYFKTRANPQIRHINLTSINLQAVEQTLMFPVQSPHHGNVTNLFFDYSHQKSVSHTTNFTKAYLDYKKLHGPPDVDSWVERAMRHHESCMLKPKRPQEAGRTNR